jgi:hypothetical protein
MNNNKIEKQFLLLAIRLHSQWKEVWLPIRCLPSHEVSSQGKVRNLATKAILKQKIHHGYLQINVSAGGKRKTLQVHRLVCSAFYLNTQNKPCVDHFDDNKSNNHVQNLRWATHSENGMNISKQCNNTTGIVGVYWHKRKMMWCASIQIDGIQKYLGYFVSMADAKNARIKAVVKMFGSFANTQTNK